MESHTVHPSCLVSGEWVGAWRILKRLGTGAFGAVYLVECEGEILALKFALRPVESDDLNQTGARLRKELACLLQIQHPNVVQIYAFGRWPHPMRGYPYLLMEYVDGPTLHEWRRQARPTFRQVIELFGKLALTLDALDHEHLRHRDMKGSNILVRARDGEPVLVDFGAADYAQATRLTEGPLPPGTPHYRSPEAIRFHRQHFWDRAARYRFRVTDDLYGLGVALYEVLAGRLPFSPDLPWEVLNAEIERRVPLPPAYFDERIPPAMSQLVMRLIAKDPRDRPQTGKILYEELQALLRDGGPALDERTHVRPVDLITTEPG
jgi:serine/threonine-protein kinase